MIKIDKGYAGLPNGRLAQLTGGYLIDGDRIFKMFPQTEDIASAVVTLGAALTYNGSVQTKKLASVVLDGKTLVEGTDYTVSGNTGTNAGSYTLTVTGIGDYEGTVTKPWSIAVRKLTKPTVSGSFTYNGSSRSCTVSGMNSAYITQSGTTSATNAGTYTVTFTLKSTSNTQWSDGTTAAVSRTWSIAQATGSISVSPTSLTVKGAAGSTATATITYTGDGSISVASNKTSVATVSRSGTKITVKSVAAGSATITITMAAGTNYTGASCTISVTVAILAFGSYSGDYEKLSNVTIDGVEHELYQLTGSGTLVLNGSAMAWLCGGGGGGGNPGSASNPHGGGGGGGYVSSGSLAKGSYAITIGAGGDAETSGGTTKIGTKFTANPGVGATSRDGGAGGSGGGSSASNAGIGGNAGSGADVSTYPFGLTTLKAHSGGGGGGNVYASGKYYAGGSGGTNGGDGGASGTASTSIVGASSGGEYGGGGGGGANPQGSYSGKAASFYGGGGGGAGRGGGSTSGIVGGTGYQGVVYIAAPA